MGRVRFTTINTKRDEVCLYIGASGPNQSEISVDGTDVTLKANSIDEIFFSRNLENIVKIIEKFFPEVRFGEAIVDYGVASIDLLQRVEKLRDLGVPVTIVDIFEYMTPCAIAAECVVRLWKDKIDEDY